MPGNYNSDAAGGIISFTPASQLATSTTYRSHDHAGLKDLDGVPFAAVQHRASPPATSTTCRRRR